MEPQQLHFKSLILSLALLTCLAFPLNSDANPITRQQAQQNALSFLQKRGKTVTEVSLRHAPMRAAMASLHEPYYVFNIGNNQGFIIASGDDCAHAVLGYADSGSIDVDNIPCNMQWWLDEYARQIEFMQKPSATPSCTPKKTDDFTPIAPLLKSKWGQYEPYNLFCPIDQATGDRCVTGCVATAMAQMMYYHRANSVKHTILEIPSYFYNTPDNTVDAIPAGSLIDWDNMLDAYDYNYETHEVIHSTTAQDEAVAQLMKYCGVAVKMNYGSSGSSASINPIINSLFRYFQYNPFAYGVGRDYMEDSLYEKLIYSELNDHRPVIYAGNSDLGGHAFICDGYDGNGYYHFNWGWSGFQDGFFLLTANDTNDALNGYTSNQWILVHIEPLPIPPTDDQGDGIHFIDPFARSYCLFLADTNGDYVLTKSEAAAMTDNNKINFAETALNSFNEFKYFTGITNINDAAFRNCPYLESITFPNSVTKIGKNAFSNCSSLTNVKIPNSVATLDYNAFSECTNLTSVSIPSPIILYDNLFKDCNNLKKVTIGKSIQRIEKGVFYNCTGLSTISCLSINPPYMDPYQFHNVSIANFARYNNKTLRVPINAVEAYKSAYPWSLFGNIVGLDPSLGDVNLDGEISIADINVIIDCIIGDVDCLNEFMGDVNCDGEVNIADINTIIDKI